MDDRYGITLCICKTCSAFVIHGDDTFYFETYIIREGGEQYLCMLM